MSIGGSSEARQADKTEHNLKTLIADAEKMGLTPDIRDILEGLDEYKRRLEVKVQELSIIEAIAMESKDENIRALREELFMAVKLIHSDEIAEVENEYNQRESMQGSSPNLQGGLISGGMSLKNTIEDTDEEISKYAVMERMRRYLNRRTEYKQFMKRQ